MSVETLVCGCDTWATDACARAKPVFFVGEQHGRRCSCPCHNQQSLSDKGWYAKEDGYVVGGEKAHELSHAILSGDRIYRYMLSRIWNIHQDRLVIVGLNPSTADAYEDDQTIRKLRVIAKRNGYGGIVMLNLFALRSTDPDLLSDMYMDVVGPFNRAILQLHAGMSKSMLLCWGAHRLPSREDIDLLTRTPARVTLLCLGQNLNGSPKHPLYLTYETPIRRFDRQLVKMD